MEPMFSAFQAPLITQPLPLDWSPWMCSPLLTFLYAAFPCPGSCFLPCFTWLPFFTFKTHMLSQCLHRVMMQSPFLTLKLILGSLNTDAARNSTSACILISHQVWATKLIWMSYWYSRSAECPYSDKHLFFRQVEGQEEVTIEPRSMAELAL